LLLNGCSNAPDVWREAKPGQKRVLASFAPLYCMARAVAGDDAYVLCFVSTQGPHDFIDSPKDMLKLYRADLILTNGLGLDDQFMDKLAHGARKAESVVKVGEAVPEAELLHPQEEHNHAHAGHHHHHGEHDPHVWLGPPEA